MMKSFSRILLALSLLLSGLLHAQGLNATQAVVTEGLLASGARGSFRAAAYEPDGSLILLADLHDGIRLYKSSTTATTLAAQAHTGSTGDSGLALALDPSGNIYVAGTTSSGSLSGTSGTPFPTRADTSTNSFLAKYDANLNLLWLTFLGAGRTSATALTATADAVFVTGITYNASFPVTPAGIQQSPSSGSFQNGFVERFNSSGSTLVYATYLTGYGGDTTPAAIAADSSDNAYIAGQTSASGYPTTAALEPRIAGTSSGFLTKLTPAGDGFVFSTFLAGAGVTSLALDNATSQLLLTGSIDLGKFPIDTVAQPLIPTTYQSLIRLPLDGQSVSAGVLLVPGSISYVTPAPNGSAWISGSLTEPLFPGIAQPDLALGDTFLLHVTSGNNIDQTLRFGGAASGNSLYASMPTTPAAPAVTGNGAYVALPDTVNINVAASLATTERFDLPLVSAPNALLPNVVRDFVNTCTSGQCSGSAGLLAVVETNAAQPSLGISADLAPNVLVRNLGSATASGLAITASGFTETNNCGATLDPSNRCTIALTGTGPGSVTVSAANAPTQTQQLPANTLTPDPLALSAAEIDFGIVAFTDNVQRTLTVTNLSSTAQTFSSALEKNVITTAFSYVQSATDCPGANTAGSYTLAAGASCHITLSLTGSAANTNNIDARALWQIGAHELPLVGYVIPAPLSVSASAIDFGTAFTGSGSIHLPRYLYLSNNSNEAIAHAAIALPLNSAFIATDHCPSILEPHTVCRIDLTYTATSAPSADTTTLTVDGLSVLITGTTLPPASTTGTTANPNITVTPTALTFSAPVNVTQPSGTTQTVTVKNIGASSVPLSIAITGDFTLTNYCPAALSAGASCALQIGFTPSAPGTRNGLLSVAGGSGFAPAYVTLTGTGTPILPNNNGVLALGTTYVGEPLVTWYKIQQPLTTLTVTTGNPAFGVILVQDTGNGHGSPAASAFTQTATSACANCWLGVQFLSTTAGTQTSTLTLSSVSGGAPEVLTVTATALPVQGLLLNPPTFDFGPVNVDSTSPPQVFTLANLLANSAAANIQSVTISGDFQLAANATGGPSCSGQLASTSACTIEVFFAPTAIGARTGTLTVTTDAGTVTSSLTGYGNPDPGFALAPDALVFNNIPGATATKQTIAFTNTSGVPLTIGTITSTNSAFAPTTTCATVAPGASCSITVTFTPQTSTASGSLALPITATVNGQTATTTYAIPLTSTYTSSNAGLMILPNQANFGATSTGTLGITREFTLLNFSVKTLNVALNIPQQFPLANPGSCASLSPGASCVFSVSFLPELTGEATGTVTATGTPTDGSPAITALAYMIGNGIGSGSLLLSGSALIPNSPLDFGQITSGQNAQQTLTLTNNGLNTITIRRITSVPPFFSTNTCAAPLAPNATCTVSLTYAPINEVANSSLAGSPRSDTGQLTIESDTATSPLTLALTGRTQPVVSSSPASSAVLATYSLSEGALTFANTPVGNASTPQSITLTNTGTRTLNISAITPPTDFTDTTNCSVLQPGDTCTISIAFVPTNASTSDVRAGTLEISTDSAVSLNFISLLGVSSPSPLTLSPNALTFGTVNVGSSAQLNVAITNTTAAPVTFFATSASGDYSVARGSCPPNGATLAAGSSCTLVVTFTPTTTGTRTGTLSLSTDATQLPLTVALSGTGASAHLTASPSALNFGSIAVGSPANLTLTLTNSGSAAVTSITTSITGADAKDFAVTVPCALTSIAPSQGCNLTVTFTPSHTGAESATLSIASSDPASPLMVPLSGSGAQAGGFTLTVNGGSSATQTVKSGSPAVYTLQLTPTGGFTGTVALTCTPVNPAQYASCSLLASQLSLANGAQTSTATINTITSMAARTLAFAGIFILLPWWRRRTGSRLVANALVPVAAVLAFIALGGCGGGGSSSSNSNIRYSPPGSYSWQVTASSTSGPAISQTVTLTLNIQ